MKSLEKDLSYRKEWIRQRIVKLASIIGLDVVSHAIISNQLHVTLAASLLLVVVERRPSKEI